MCRFDLVSGVSGFTPLQFLGVPSSSGATVVTGSRVRLLHFCVRKVPLIEVPKREDGLIVFGVSRSGPSPPRRKTNQTVTGLPGRS